MRPSAAKEEEGKRIGILWGGFPESHWEGIAGIFPKIDQSLLSYRGIRITTCHVIAVWTGGSQHGFYGEEFRLFADTGHTIEPIWTHHVHTYILQRHTFWCTVPLGDMPPSTISISRPVTLHKPTGTMYSTCMLLLIYKVNMTLAFLYQLSSGFSPLLVCVSSRYAHRRMKSS